jgi:hypothetical protein
MKKRRGTRDKSSRRRVIFLLGFAGFFYSRFTIYDLRVDGQAERFGVIQIQSPRPKVLAGVARRDAATSFSRLGFTRIYSDLVGEIQGQKSKVRGQMSDSGGQATGLNWFDQL